MQLITTLLGAVAILTMLSGVSILFGSRKQNRSNAVWFFLATIGSAVWSSSIALFLGLGSSDFAPALIVGIIAGITLSDVALLGYSGWKTTSGKILLFVFGILGVSIVGILALRPEVFYSSISINNDCNQIEIVKGWYYVALIVYYTLITLAFSGFLSRTIKKTTNKSMKIGLIVFYVGLSIGGILALVFDLILLSSVPSLIWIGPMAVSVTILTFYYSVVRYKVVGLSSKWMKIMSSIILSIFGIIIYMLVFYAVFTALFKIPNPSPAVLLLNLIMVVILILLLPALRELKMFMKSMIDSENIQFEYIIKKISQIKKEDFSYKELASFIADNLHYSYIIFIVDGRAYSSANTIRLSADEITKIEKLEKPENGIWQIFNRADVKMFDNYEISRIGALIDKNGKVFGQVVFGKKLTKFELSRKSLIEYETIINFAAMVIENGSSKS